MLEINSIVTINCLPVTKIDDYLIEVKRFMVMNHINKALISFNSWLFVVDENLDIEKLKSDYWEYIAEKT